MQTCAHLGCDDRCISGILGDVRGDGGTRSDTSLDSWESDVITTAHIDSHDADDGDRLRYLFEDATFPTLSTQLSVYTIQQL